MAIRRVALSWGAGRHRPRPDTHQHRGADPLTVCERPIAPFRVHFGITSIPKWKVIDLVHRFETCRHVEYPPGYRIVIDNFKI